MLTDLQGQSCGKNSTGIPSNMTAASIIPPAVDIEHHSCIHCFSTFLSCHPYIYFFTSFFYLFLSFVEVANHYIVQPAYLKYQAT